MADERLDALLRAESRLTKSFWAAPFLAMIPIPIVSTIIGVSPLSIKFLLGGQLAAAIRQESFAGIHEGV
jgi:hypothetical protein